MNDETLLLEAAKVFEFENCDALFWRFDNGRLGLFASCSDFFSWGCADLEPIESEADVAALRQARADLADATGTSFPTWIGELYAARRRNCPPAGFMLSGKYALEPEVAALFPKVQVG